MEPLESPTPAKKHSFRQASCASSAPCSSVSSTSCSLSSTASAFQVNGSAADRAKRVPIGNGGRQKFLFSRLGTLVDKNAKNLLGGRQLGVRIPFHNNVKAVVVKHMKPDELEKVKPKQVVHYCTPKELLYSKDTFKSKKARLVKSSASLVKARSLAQHPLEHAYIHHTYSEGRSLGRQDVILEIELSATLDAVLPHGTLDDNRYLSLSLASVARVRDLATGQTKLLKTSSINSSHMDLKRGQQLWYSPTFTEQTVKDNLTTEAEYKHLQSSPPKVYSRD